MWQREDMCGEGGCVVKGLHGDGGVHGKRDMHGKGHAWQGGMRTGETTTEVGGMHSTGMHSCLNSTRNQLSTNLPFFHQKSHILVSNM